MLNNNGLPGMLARPPLGPMLEVRLGDTAPERKGAGISDSIRPNSSSPSVTDVSLASCSQDIIDPRITFSLLILAGSLNLNDEVDAWVEFRPVLEVELSAVVGGKGETYESSARIGRLERVGVCGTSRLRPGWIRGIAGVGAPASATGASRSSMSSSSSSSLFASDICDMLPALPAPEADVLEILLLEEPIVLKLLGRVRWARGEGVSRDRGENAAFVGVAGAVLDDSPNLAFNPDVFGVDPLGVDDLGPPDCKDELDDGGRELVAEVFTILVGREGDDVFIDPGVGGLGFVGELCGDTLSEFVRFALSAARCGRGLIGRWFFSAGEVIAITGLFCCSFFSSSDVLSLLRVPTRGAGDGGLVVCSTTTDFGRYFGKADPEVALAVLGRSVATLPLSVVGRAGETASVALLPVGATVGCSSEEPAAERWWEAEIRLRDMVFPSGVAVRIEGGLESPMESLGAVGCVCSV